MRLHRFFVKSPIGTRGSVEVDDSDLAHQLKNVFRFTAGGQVILFDNSGLEYRAMVVAFKNGRTSFSIISSREGQSDPRREVYLFASIIKKDKFEWVLEKGTELGVTVFVPIISDRSEKKSLNMERMHKIIQESTEQSGRSILPTVQDPVVLENALSQDFPCFAFDPGGDTFTIEHAQSYSPLGIFVGPEGGWTDREVFLFKQNDMRVYSLGPQVLRAETASFAVSALILLQ